MIAVRHLTILGSTGSIGVSTLDVVARHPDRFRVVALTANKSVQKILEQCRRFEPRYAVLLDEASAELLQVEIRRAGLATEVLWGVDSLEKVASLPDVDTVMAAIVGAAGIRPTFAAAATGKRVLLANKETMVMAGRIFTDVVKENHATLLPIDSEHNAIFQSLPQHFSGDLRAVGVRRILLTASGGPFRQMPLAALENVTPGQACAHPNWVMGQKISVDSATMMNKGLEVIEAHWLFEASPEQIEVVVHPQSIIHSMVEYVDGSVLAQLGNPDMRTPIAHALGFPERIETGVNPLDMFKVARLDFEAPDFERFPCLRLAYQALASGGSAPAVLNAANEVAVDSFLKCLMPFTSIPAMIEDVMQTIGRRDIATLDDVLAADGMAREAAQEWLTCLA
ncbi:1-deoxy-D-xylulose 5-phosphate reductoisomerase [Nitrosospira multiformis ATCC 25196]|uniref:1-deoxy-D-xylulose 5-phosphate reductoisomerase n=2 Tax=Nitrosospira multiformis (strain ATCC 25196 / NCIMB 11849 / C 71) TaxID=323848 RepID=DXR_NITMU|nr:1-deoxy-D-xylulose-5-phosphate reductoisomerase [Nitrosospira multiformis]Q2YBA1.1 RecName: Full=1-deoxy-D-xylulose 5-phosphate reductoisomerase; Short=DXP reductoisomerase; AltName: Full=1-deoxyxylulose-5-phosphate reductoisomerase; AltName: Full=2-C-methyl-D-erythritol 4-phosphate synthase [Nitrosospira multiformis ATCC 25196]ABB73970.1 1-deoxy-D-xylulose 5-phosphate reductoisomerase [Nitrosospira multiformis ATCC 25196]SEF53508.1 1-deoxy-D-xylulose 5-phosphate reductoisomerase [Nitrosospir